MQQRNPRVNRDMTILGGWLFADLLLALVIIFMASQPPFPRTVAKTPTPTLAITPTPTVPPHLEKNYTEIKVSNVDFNGILHNSPSAVNSMENFINAQAVLANRRAGLVIVYDGAASDADIHDAQVIGKAVIANVLKPMGQQGALFGLASYYNPLFVLGPDHTLVVLDIYLFAQ